MSATLKFGLGQWATKKGSTLAYNDENGNFKPLPFTFDRSTSATRVNKEGLIEVVSNNEPRIDFLNDSKGALLLEPSRTNFMRYSNGFDNAAWDKGGSGVASAPVVTSNQGVSPDGTNNAFKIDFNLNGSTSTVDRSRLTQFFTGTISTNYTFTYWIKAFSVSDVGKVLNFAVDNVNNFGNITVTENWQKIVFTGQSIGTIINNHIQLRGGYGTSDSVSILLYGYQAEEGSYATSYIPTQGSIGTRVAETCNGAGNAQIFNGSEGVLFVEMSALANDSTTRRINLRNSSGSNQVRIEFGSSSNLISGVLFNGANQAVINNTSNNILNSNKIAFKYKENDFALWINGVKVGTDISGTTIGAGILDRIDLSLSSTETYSNIKQIQYFNTALTDQQLISLTKI